MKMNPTGDAMDVDPPSATPSKPEPYSKPEPKQETNENLTDDQVKVSTKHLRT